MANKNLIVHALDGRGAHFAGLFKRFFKVKTVITPQVSFPFKRKSSLTVYQNADILVGISKEIEKNLSAINPNTTTIYGCLKTLQENQDFELQFFPKNDHFKIAQIGNFQTVKNFPLTIELAKQNPNVDFYLVGSGELEQELKSQANGLKNVHFIPFTPYVGSVLKQVDLLIMPSFLEGLPLSILEAYQYQIPVLAHATGGIPEIVEHGKTGFLIQPNQVEQYQIALDVLLNAPNKMAELKQHLSHFLQQHDFSAERMARDYANIYKNLL